jgi:hypothetical protein
MPLRRNPVNTRKIALLETLGWRPDQIPEDGVSRDGFWVLGDYRDKGELHFENDAPVRTWIEWPEEYRQLASDAISLDYAEEVGALSGENQSSQPS